MFKGVQHYKVVKVIWKRTHRRRTRTVQWYWQVAPVCTRTNSCFLEPTWVHNPNSISIGSGIFEQLTGISFPLELPWARSDLEPYLIHSSVGPPESTP